MGFRRCFLKYRNKIYLFLFILLIYFFSKLYWINKENKVRKIDYNDYSYMRREQHQTGVGELGLPASLPESLNVEKENLYKVNGFNARLSDEIALNRSLKDLRHPLCQQKLYSSNLPSVSVIIPFHNEHWTTLLRTVFSIFNRSPKHLLKEIVVVDDASTKEFLKEKLEEYLSEHIPVAKVVRLKERQGLIRARLEGAKVSSGEAFVFLDSHTECATNWLPPLLEPISANYRTAVCPFIDVIDFETFEYCPQDGGRRGSFDWDFYYKRLPLLQEDLDRFPEPFKSPVMAGGLFAISSRFFWELGGYDPGLDIWGGEQYELSFKIWQCHGTLLDAPCSRIGHVYKKFAPFQNPRNDDFIARNYRRVADVWMDEYKEFLYMRKPHWKSINTGDLTEQLAVRERNKCKPFKWFMENVAFDLEKRFPPVEPPDYASGSIRSVLRPDLCLDSLFKEEFEQVDTVNPCTDVHSQKFQLAPSKDLRPMHSHVCFDVPNIDGPKSLVFLYGCHKALGNQMWKYDMKTKQIRHSNSGSHCVDMSVNDLKFFVAPCNSKSRSQKWSWSNLNEERMKKFDQLEPLQESM